MEKIVTAWLVVLWAVVGVCTACDKRAVHACSAKLDEEYTPNLEQVIAGEISEKKFYEKNCRMVERYYMCITPPLVGCDEEYIKGWTDVGKQKRCGIDGQGTTQMTGTIDTSTVSRATHDNGYMVVMTSIAGVVIVSL